MGERHLWLTSALYTYVHMCNCVCVHAHSHIHIPTLANTYTIKYNTDRNTLEAGQGKSSDHSNAESHTSRRRAKLSVAIPVSSGTWPWVESHPHGGAARGGRVCFCVSWRYQCLCTKRSTPWCGWASWGKGLRTG